jgi:hypothetical protein
MGEAKLSERDKGTDKQKRRERIQRKFRSTWGERKKNDVVMRREKISIG